jgi:uncharacterized protein (TIGR02453 family)
MFNGFSENTIKYLEQLGMNNNKAWFEENRPDYEEFVLNRFKALVMELGPYMCEMDPFLDIRPNKCISRIYRDVRFSKNKAPYRNNMWISFKRSNKDWKNQPTYYFELFTHGYRFGMGFYDAPKEFMEELREKLLTGDKELMKLIKNFKKQNLFRLEGVSYKKTLNASVPEELREWYQKKDLYFVCDRELDDKIFTPQLVDELVESFRQLLPFHDYFNKLMGNRIRA